ncbi:MAG: hypothetical protein H6765_05865 [Candidatus Peribacteria bacterium]|nr:MAG: hypothetical protein H6765_05865 [Candidatus Peribacteria bacterium]
MTKEQFERAKILLAIKLVNREQHKAKRVDYLKAADSLPDLFSQPETPPTN